MYVRTKLIMNLAKMTTYVGKQNTFYIRVIKPWQIIIYILAYSYANTSCSYLDLNGFLVELPISH